MPNDESCSWGLSSVSHHIRGVQVQKRYSKYHILPEMKASGSTHTAFNFSPFGTEVIDMCKKSSSSTWTMITSPDMEAEAFDWPGQLVWGL